ncbi:MULTISPECIES: hypothetical protein [Pseudomonas]|uniref:hypothetical protein n=1 Tax=Pseudomonas TaxID=286 RepID=UPI0008A362C3|nr:MULTISPECIES: hypothetical protein [Pseudomonas]OFR55893.1 hypothetical protein HMPREF2886_02235 [Pseudomonas sp. HMSC066A08]RUE55931.1 hypothetical protein IPC1224_14500 [Pseudomonas aeruginosa]HEQ0196596.1 hypothetical protein [Pseudomonas aeruginosa]
MREQLEPLNQEELALRTYSLVFDALLACSSAEEQRRMVNLFLCHSAIFCRLLGGPQAFEDVVGKIRAMKVGSDWLQQVMRMH